MSMMKAAVFLEKGRIELVDKKIPDVGPNDALVKITTTTITTFYITPSTKVNIICKPRKVIINLSHHSKDLNIIIYNVI